MTPRELWGWAPREVTEYEYDDAGRLVRSVTTSEPRFDDDSLGLLRAWQDVESDRHSCGHLFSESTDPENEGRYVVDPPTRCHACTAIEKAAKDYEKAPNRHALSFHARLKE